MSDNKPAGHSLDESGVRVGIEFVITGILSVFGLNPDDPKPSKWQSNGNPEDLPGYVPKGTI